MKAVIYSRVSTDEQKENGFSLQDQTARLKKYCREKKYEIVKHYQDDHSAKNFNRPAFKEFLIDVKSKVIKPDIFLCVRMDRFSRDSFESLNMLRDFKRQDIKFETIENNIELDSPESIIPYMLNLVLPEVENKRRGLNTKRGLRQALREGRWTSKAPIGYYNDIVNKIILPHKNFAPIISWAFEVYAKGLYSVSEIRNMMLEKGLKISKQAFYNFISNKLYIGKIVIKQWENEPEEIVNGIHEPIVAEEIFFECQKRLTQKKKPYQGKTSSEELPLKGFLICPKCGRIMTGSASKGNGGLYHYYHCQRKYGCNNSYKANDANTNFINYLNSFEISDEVANLYVNILEDVFAKQDDNKQSERHNIEQAIKNIDNQIDSLENKFLDELISAEQFNHLTQKLEYRKNDLVSKHVVINSSKKDFNKYLSFGFSMLADLSNYYKEASTTTKQRIIGSIFPEKIIYENKEYRTSKMNEVIRLLCAPDKAFAKRKPIKFDRLSIVAPLSIQLSNHFYEDLAKIAQLEPFLKVKMIC
jgi:site-specific DNA recombinase